MNIIHNHPRCCCTAAIVIPSEKTAEIITWLEARFGRSIPIQTGAHADLVSAWMNPPTGLSGNNALSRLWLKKGFGLEYWKSEEFLDDWYAAIEDLKAI